MKIAIHQTKIVFEDKEKNYNTAKKAIQLASKYHVNFIVFPEMSFTGFSMNVNKVGEESQETIQYIKKIAVENRISIGFGWVKKIEEQNKVIGENHYSIINQNGQVISDYIKCHPFSYAQEDEYYLKGTQITYCEMNEFHVSSTICYDLRFPELYQAISKKSDLILVPANWPMSRRSQWITLLQARAIENQCYIIGANCCGEINGLTYSGDSCIIHPSGKIIETTEDNDLLMADIINDVVTIRSEFPVRKDRRETFYQNLYTNQELMVKYNEE